MNPIIFGLVAGTLTTISFIPQLIKILKTKSAKDISLFMYLLLLSGYLLWTVYGLYLHSLPIILFNIIGIVLVIMILFFKTFYKN
ncbi:MAG: SemiSWEET transporter [Candidatus Margulisbacteria bacterium]|nr:SemiSWEET transporter [Candidatus Margulisiibacteriota bacterium]